MQTQKKLTIQKKYLVLVKISDNLYELVLVIINIIVNLKDRTITVVNYTREKVGELVYNLNEKTARAVKRVIGVISNFKYTSLAAIKVRDTHKINKSKNSDFLIYSNLLAPPIKSNLR